MAGGQRLLLITRWFKGNQMCISRLLLITLVVFQTIGCASSGPRFNPDTLEVRDDMATVYFYRLSAFHCLYCDFRVIANDKEVANLSNREQFKKFMRPGIYKFHSKHPGLVIDHPVDVILDPGKITYLRGSYHNRFIYTDTYINEVDSAQAIKEISDL